ncbi:MAG: hypothetical protein ACTTJY_04795, partial [Hoylesella shahii]|uniref:hypothetical protein n=1 Tax=Hoylesella shahii TaxID=228603 RepID=UPI003F9ED735
MPTQDKHPSHTRSAGQINPLTHQLQKNTNSSTQKIKKHPTHQLKNSPTPKNTNSSTQKIKKHPTHQL